MTNLAEDREAWLRNAIEIFRPRFIEVGAPLPEKIRISIGFGSTGARQENSKILGVTYVRRASADHVNEIFISPEDADTVSMLHTVLHELIHVSDDGNSGHKGHFAEIATRLGLQGRMTHSEPSLTLAAELMTIAAELGTYPGAALILDPSKIEIPVPVGPDGLPIPDWTPPKIHTGPGKQGTRMLKVSCQKEDCEFYGYTVRTTNKWLDQAAPVCPGSVRRHPVSHRIEWHELER